MTEYTIRRIRYEELDACADIIRRSFGTVADEFGLTVDNCPTNGAFLKTERLVSEMDQGTNQYGLYCSGTLIGFIELKEKDGGAYTIEKLAVLPERRHNGGGGHLLAFACGEARKMGGNKIKIGIIEENTRLKDWYLKHGFVHTGTTRFEHIPFTVGFMEKQI